MLEGGAENARNTVVVMGAGLSGAFAALALAEKYKVILIEMADKIIPETSTSYNQCYKLHTGRTHYLGDLPTALSAQDAAIKFIRYIGGANSKCLAKPDPTKSGTLLIMENSQFTLQEIEDVENELEKRYLSLVEEDPANEVLGKPEAFIRRLSADEYALFSDQIPYFDSAGQVAGHTKVVGGYETTEPQIDIDEVRIFLEEKIAAHPNIVERRFGTKVLSVAHSETSLGYSVRVKRTDQTGKQIVETLACDGVCNCTWNKSEHLDMQGGFYAPEENRALRVKATAKIQLPPQLYDMNTTTFSVGPYASMTNLGNAQAIFSSEVTTNIGHYPAGNDRPPLQTLNDTPTSVLSTMAKTMQVTPNALLSTIAQGKLSPDTGIGQLLGERIRAESAKYFKDEEISTAIEKAPILEVMVGHVKMMDMGKQEYKHGSLHERDSPIHQRQHSGVEERDLCYISNSGNKATYTLRNADTVVEIFDQHFNQRNQLANMIYEVKTSVKEALTSKGLLEKYSALLPSLLYTTCKRALRTGSAIDVVANDVMHTLLSKPSTASLASMHGLFRTPNKRNVLRLESTADSIDSDDMTIAPFDSDASYISYDSGDEKDLRSSQSSGDSFDYSSANHSSDLCPLDALDDTISFGSLDDDQFIKHSSASLPFQSLLCTPKRNLPDPTTQHPPQLSMYHEI